MEIQTVQENMIKLMEYLRTNAFDLAQKKGAYEQKKDFAKSQLAICCLEAGGKSQAEKMNIALASEKYQSFLAELADVRLQYINKKCQYEAAQGRLEAYRSLNKHLA